MIAFALMDGLGNIESDIAGAESGLIHVEEQTFPLQGLEQDGVLLLTNVLEDLLHLYISESLVSRILAKDDVGR